MKSLRNISVLITIAYFLISCSSDIEWVSTTEKNSWAYEDGLRMEDSNEKADIEIDTTARLQIIEGFGACFNELGYTSLNLLSAADKDDIFTELFKPDFGSNFTICRMPIGANDFSLDWYSYNETEGDFAMNNFNIVNDKQTLVPFIKEALSKNPDLKLWASPWSPPSWMKWNKHYACRVPSKPWDPQINNYLPADRQGKEGTNMFIQEDAYFHAYALYFSKFIESYHDQGIKISMVMPQNEFNSCQIFPSCTWTAAGLATFLGKYLGPSMAKQNVEIMFGTMERPNATIVDSIINDSLAGKYIKGVGFQWAGKSAIPIIQSQYPNLKLYQTEQECGDGMNDWKNCLHSWDLMKHYFTNGVSAYMYWNISLTQDGFSRWGWQQNSLITVDTLNKTYRYNHEFYLMKHLSHYVKPGAVQIKKFGKYLDYLAFQNPDKSIVLVIYSENEMKLKIRMGSKVMAPTLKKGSFNTFLLD